MNKTSYIIVAIVVVVAIVFGALYFLGVFDYKSSNPKDYTMDQETITEEVVTINAYHQFKNGKHIIAGELAMPTPCHILETSNSVRESSPEQVSVNFNLSSNAEMCAQLITPTRFSTEFTASEDAIITATMNGKPAVLNLIPVPEGQDLEDFEIFIKG